jgi:hypothetical protein
VRSWLLAAATLTAASAATAQFATGTLFVSHDSDDFDELRITAGATADNGFGAAVGAMRYSAPGWSANGSSLVATYKEFGRERQIDASLGAARIDGRDYAIGNLEYLHSWTDGNALGLSVERNIVGSQGGIEDGIVYNVMAGVGDYVFTPAFNVGAAAGLTYFSDGNQRPFLRTRWNWSLDERYGLNAYVKTRSYRNSDPYRPQYYSPPSLNEVSLGLSARWRASDQVVLAAWADAGMQYTTGDDQPIWSAFVGFQSPRNAPIRWNLGLLATNTASLFTSQSGAYNYLSLAGQVNVPF